MHIYEWTADRVEILRNLWLVNKMSCGQIAMEMGGGLSRNAVSGKVHRLGLPKSEDRYTKAERALREKARVEAARLRFNPLDRLFKPVERFTEPLNIECLNVSFDDLERYHCRYVTSEVDTPVTYCGLAKTFATNGSPSSYCVHHHSVCWSPAPPMKRKPAKQLEAAS